MGVSIIPGVSDTIFVRGVTQINQVHGVSEISPSVPPIITQAIRFDDVDNYVYAEAKMGQPLTYTGFHWFKIPANTVLPTVYTIRHFGNIINEDTEVYPGIRIYIQTQSSNPNSNCSLTYEAYSFDGFNQVPKLIAKTRNAANTVNTFPLQRNVWYALYISSNYDDGNSTAFALGANGTAPSVSTWYGDTDPIFPINPFNPIATAGPTTYAMGIVYSVAGGEAICDMGYEANNALVYSDGTIRSSNVGIHTDYYQCWDSTESDTSLNAYQAFFTALTHPKDLGSVGDDPFGTQPLNYFNGDGSEWGDPNLGYGNTYICHDALPVNVVGPT